MPRLPARAVDCYVKLSFVDRVMFAFRFARLMSADYKTVLVTRNRIQHSLLSLPPWHDLTDAEQASSDQVL